MTDSSAALELAEAKKFVGLHARHMGLRTRRVQDTLRRITALHGDQPGSWLAEWSRLAEEHQSRGRHQAAADHYNLARFPCADTAAKRRAEQLAAQSLRGLLRGPRHGRRQTLVHEGREVTVLFRPGPRRSAPLVVMMGGIVSLKEQWGSLLAAVPRAGCAVAIADFPGVGENRLPYSRTAGQVFSAVIDAVGGDCDGDRTLVVAPSFAGHLALTQAPADPRIQGVVTVGAPLRKFFTDSRVRDEMPRITRTALERACRLSPGALDAHLSELALNQDQLAALEIPVHYVASLRDEIIPTAEWRRAAALNPRWRVHAFDDVHGSPHHVVQTRAIILSAILAHAGRPRAARALGALRPLLPAARGGRRS
ncbi:MULTISPECIES: alpha/beta hydrolase [Streptomyces]|uniref:alpha/beta hydrolase n=1 Tax=Streptomyces TaxID=1883 RepID=UPI0019CFEB56|nr:MULTISPECIES: alpha/beta hydrolase [Streptomyces]